MIDRFRQFLIMHIFPGHPKGKEHYEEFLKVIQSNFFDSLKGHPVTLSSISSISWKDLDNIQIEISGKYSAHKTTYGLTLDKHLKVKKLLV